LKRVELPGYADRVEVALAKKGVKQRGLVGQQGLTATQVSRWSRSLPGDFDSLKRFAEALGVEWQWLLVGDEGLKAMGALSPRDPIIIKLGDREWGIASYRETERGHSVYEVTRRGIRSLTVAATIATQEREKQKL
jgi:transcriptional regulator with XRE-family HTH domain